MLANHALADRERVAFDDIKQENIILFQREKALGLFDSIINLCQQNQFSPLIPAQPKHMQTMLTMCTHGRRFVRIKNYESKATLSQASHSFAKKDRFFVKNNLLNKEYLECAIAADTRLSIGW